jgi:hypothetical protein
LRAAGHEVTSRWHSGTIGEPRLELDDPRLRDRALDDLNDLYHADTLLAFGQAGSRGGRHFEAGAAFAIGLEVWLIGKPEHAFHLLSHRFFPKFNDVMEFLKDVRV